MDDALLTAAAALGAALLGAGGGALAPRLVAGCPDPVPDPDEDPDDFPDHVPFAVLGARPGLVARCAAVGGLAGAALGAALGLDWALVWSLALLPFAVALAVIDQVTWFLPTWLVARGALAVLAVEVVAAAALREPRVLLAAAVGAAALGLYYGLIWFVSPRSMAFGDVRLGALLGLALGPLGLGVLALSVVLAAVLLGISHVPLRRRGGVIRRRQPFGPFLVLGAWAAVVLAPGAAALLGASG
ncbi:hypothetical protein [Nocardioides sp.]|uniref:hypothetical protein n=1 Tax=Nocardioides sp. TaxID=35761 RepID=UPI003518A914